MKSGRKDPGGEFAPAETFIPREDLDDKSLVERFKRTKNPEVFGVLFNRHARRIYALSVIMLRNGSQAEDVVQETFIRALTKIDHFNEKSPESCFESWITTICKHLCIGEIRKMNVRRAGRVEIQSISSSVHMEGEAETLLEEVGECMDAMDERVKTCYLLFALEGFTYKEVASLTHYSMKDVKNYLRAAKRGLKRYFK